MVRLPAWQPLQNSQRATYPLWRAVETLWRFITTGQFVPKTHPSNLILGAGLLIGIVLAGSSFCGWVCPFGALQDALTWLRKALHLPEVKVPAKADRILRYGRFVTLGLILLMTVSTVKLWFAGFDPYRTLFGLEWLVDFNLAERACWRDLRLRPCERL
jgi:polyferredoxin